MPTASERSALQAALADGFATGLFVLVAASFGQLSKDVAPLLGLSPAGAGLALVIVLLVAMTRVTAWLGGAVFNPANNAFLYALGQGSASEHLVRVVAQAFGGVTGALLALSLLPDEWKSDLSGAALGVRAGYSLPEGAACEFTLGSLLAFIVLVSGQLKSSTLQLWVPLLATVLAVKAGEHITGPSLNPAYTYAWVFIYPTQSVLEHFLVFWLAPIASGIFGGWAFLGWQQFQAARKHQPAHAKED